MSHFVKAIQSNRPWSSLPCSIILLLLLTGCGLQATPLPGAIQREATVVLPTAGPTSAASPVSTRVMPIEVLTPEPTPSVTRLPAENLGLVVDVLEGDTIAVVMDGDPPDRIYQVRYIGVDAPPNSSTEPWGVVAYETNKKLVNLKVIRLVQDNTDFDADGYLLRHVFLNNQLVSQNLVEQGLAQVSFQEPNVQFREELDAAETEARENNRGIWGSALPTPTPGRVVTGTVTLEATAAATATLEATAETTATLELEPTETVEAEATEEESGEEEEEAAEEATTTPTATRTATLTPEPTEEATPESP